MIFSTKKRFLKGLVGFFVCTCAYIVYVHLMLSARQTLEKQNRKYSFQDASSYELQSQDETPPQLQITEKIFNFSTYIGSTSSPSQQFVDVAPFLFKSFSPYYVLGTGPNHEVSVVIGIPSVKRNGVSYLLQTLHSIFHNVYPVNEDSIFVVVMLAETDEDFVKSSGREIYRNFTRQVDNGLLQVISPNKSAYPDFKNLRQTFGDPMERVQWRSKEVFDAAYLMLYCLRRADYYLMMEDDVISARGYVGAIHNFIDKYKSEDFAYLSMANFNSIGKLFRMSDISKWAIYFFTFFDLKPIDWLMSDFVRIVACHPEMSVDLCEESEKRKKPLRHPSIFQHIGKQSSLKGKYQGIITRDFTNSPASSNFHVNPIAEVESSFQSVDLKDVQAWYADSGGLNAHYYVKPISANQFIIVVFENIQSISRILVKTGRNSQAYLLPTDSTVLEYQPPASSSYIQCAVFDHNGEAECRFYNQPIRSVRIRLLKNLDTSVWFDLIYIK